MDSYKILYQHVTSGDAWTKTYSVPAADSVSVGSGDVTVSPVAVGVQTQTLITSIIVCCQTGSSVTYSLGLKQDTSDGDPSNTQTIVFQKSIAAKVTEVLSMGLTLGVDNTIWVRAEGTDPVVSFTIMGIEIT